MTETVVIDVEEGRRLVKELLDQINMMPPTNMGFGWPILLQRARKFLEDRKGVTNLQQEARDLLDASLTGAEISTFRRPFNEQQVSNLLIYCNAWPQSDTWKRTMAFRKLVLFFLEHAEALLTRAEVNAHAAVPPGWKPIETAPRDGTDILAWCVHANAKYADTVAARSDWQAAVVTRWIEHNGGGWTWYGLCGGFTHWMPLPPAPGAASPTPSTAEAAPVDMILHCPTCHLQHIDEPDERTPGWTNPPHRSHLCHGCGCIWRPADVATNGVQAIATIGKSDTWKPSIASAPVRALPGREEMVRAMYNALPHTVVSPALAEITDLPIGSEVTFDIAKKAGADFAHIERYADAALALLSSPASEADVEKVAR